MRLVNGRYRGATATLLAINETDFCVSVRLEGPAADAGRELERVEYEDICKLVK